MIPPLDVTRDGETIRVEPDATSIVFAEMVFGGNFEDIPEYALRIAVAYYHGPHREAAGFESWTRIHAWARGSRVEVTIADY